MPGPGPGGIVGAMLRLDPLGDRALLLTLAEPGDAIGELVRARVRAAARLLGGELPVFVPAHAAITDIVPAYASVAVHYDPARVSCRRDESPFEAMAGWVADRVARLPDAPPVEGRLLEIPVRYGGEDGPDLDALAAARGLTPEEVVG